MVKGRERRFYYLAPEAGRSKVSTSVILQCAEQTRALGLNGKRIREGRGKV
jgi:hypothetical protein